jgi:hypothetical protein
MARYGAAGLGQVGHGPARPGKARAPMARRFLESLVRPGAVRQGLVRQGLPGLGRASLGKARLWFGMARAPMAQIGILAGSGRARQAAAWCGGAGHGLARWGEGANGARIWFGVAPRGGPWLGRAEPGRVRSGTARAPMAHFSYRFRHGAARHGLFRQAVVRFGSAGSG